MYEICANNNHLCDRIYGFNIRKLDLKNLPRIIIAEFFSHHLL